MRKTGLVEGDLVNLLNKREIKVDKTKEVSRAKKTYNSITSCRK